jgi:hypothetical protein
VLLEKIRFEIGYNLTMKKYIVSSLMALLLATALPVSAAQPVQMNSEAKAALIKELTIKLNELIIQLNAILAEQDTYIKTRVINSLANAEIYFYKMSNGHGSKKGMLEFAAI